MAESPITAQAIRARLQERLAPLTLEVVDESAAHAGHAEAGAAQGTHFRVRLCSAAFAGLNQVQRHRLVYDALADFLAAGLHALALHTETPQAPSQGSL